MYNQALILSLIVNCYDNFRLQNAQSAALKDEAARQSYMLFVICGLFLLCHILRLILAIHELVIELIFI